MPAPAVIPAPRAYINAVAVKGFVVELGMCKELGNVHSPGVGLPLLPSENIRNKHRGIVSLKRVQCTRGRPRFYCD